ncbi:hypothetical protein DPMN_049821 [Dreissena polymorpha]|uniref:Secreted protein n=1 Tax=Dreissena polymorpha TaxID=45954 RepID=A0A9D4CG05_DREPO|nr:hypothetical protein DPMN_049821 [Dreissena polymorpha]
MNLHTCSYFLFLVQLRPPADSTYPGLESYFHNRITRSPWCNGYGVRLATGRSRVRSPLWERSFNLPYRHQVLVLGPGNGLESISNK